uniref:Fibronectin type-III domain-containing protein n=1 Tax=viral metagenome TaxID=1070528 RepID=A0A6C0I7T5_9ZZZZ
MQLLLVDNRVKDFQTVTESILDTVDIVSVDFDNDTYDTLVSKIPVKTYESVGVFQENYDLNTYQLVKLFSNSVLSGVETEDPTLETWTQYKSLISYFKDTLQANTLDLMGCNIHSSPDWNYVIDYLKTHLQININSSNDNTGSYNFGGNWILESGNVDLIGKYFSNNIEKYKFVLGTVSNHTVILKNDGTVFAFGSNGEGQLGDGTTIQRLYPVQVKKDNSTYLTRVVQVSNGQNHTAFLLIDGTVYTVGKNTNGQLGDGTTQQRLYPVQVLAGEGVPLTGVVQVSCGEAFTAFLLNNGTVYTVGINTYGQIGDGTTQERWYPVQVKKDISSFLTNVVQVSCGSNTTAFILNNGTIYTVGLNNFGQLGDGTTTQRNYPVQVIKSPGVALSNVAQVICLTYHTAFLLNNGTVYAVGSNNRGQVGDGTTSNRSYPVQVKKNPSTYLTNVVKISGGYNYTTVILSNGTVYTFGYNNWGQLGDGLTTTQTSYPLQVKANNSTYLTSIVQVSCGTDYTFFLKSNGTIYAVGRNSNGQLGDGTTEQRYYPVQVLISVGNNFVGGYLITDYNNYYYKNKSNITNPNLDSLTYSDLDYSIIGIIPVPVAPTITSVNGTSLSRESPTVSISFTQTPSDSIITKYAYSIDGSSYTDLIQTSTPLTIPATGLISGQSYSFRIKAILGTGSSNASTAVSAQFTMPPVAPTITSVNGTSLSRESPTVSISFTQSPSDSTITNYSYSIDGATPFIVLTPKQKNSSLTIPATGLISGQSYSFQIKAINDAGSSNASTAVSAQFTIPPVAPTITTIRASGQTVTINFTQVPSDSTITGYEYSYSSNNGATYSPFTSENSTLLVNKTSLLITKLNSNLTYLFKIRATNGTYSESSNSIEIRLRPSLQSLIDSNVTLREILNYDYSLQDIKDAGFKGNRPTTADELLLSFSFFHPSTLTLSSDIQFNAPFSLATNSAKPIKVMISGSSPIRLSIKP